MVYDDYVAIGIFAKQMGVDAPGIGGPGASDGGKKMSLARERGFDSCS